MALIFSHMTMILVTFSHVTAPLVPFYPCATDETRNIYYQNPDLFRSQSVVDHMVDNLALTLGVGREDLNIVNL